MNDTDKEFWLKKIAEEELLNNLLDSKSEKKIESFLENLNQIKEILHIKEKNDKKIFQEYNNKIVIPTGSEETLIEELNIFNKNMYDDFPEHYNLDFPEKIKELKKEFAKPKPIKKNIFNLSQPYIQETTKELNSDDMKTILSPQSIIDQEESDYKNETLSDEVKEIYLNSEEEKQECLNEIANNLNKGNYNKLKLNRRMSLTCNRYMKKLNKIKQGFIDTYGSEIFKKIRGWIIEENILYHNADKEKKLEALNLKKEKINAKRKRFK